MHVMKGKIDKWLGKTLIFLETIVAVFSVFVLLCLLIEQIWLTLRYPADLMAAENSVTTYQIGRAHV